VVFISLLDSKQKWGWFDEKEGTTNNPGTY
jgi:hypothetical protein